MVLLLPPLLRRRRCPPRFVHLHLLSNHHHNKSMRCHHMIEIKMLVTKLGEIHLELFVDGMKGNCGTPFSTSMALLSLAGVAAAAAAATGLSFLSLSSLGSCPGQTPTSCMAASHEDICWSTEGVIKKQTKQKKQKTKKRRRKRPLQPKKRNGVNI